MNKMHLVIPMAGAGSRFQDVGYELPKPMIKLKGKPFFYWSAMSVIKYNVAVDVNFLVLEEHIRNYSIDREIKMYFPEANIISIPQVLKGPVFTCLKYTEQAVDDLPIIFNDCDHLFRCDSFFYDVKKYGFLAAGNLFTFDSDAPQYSYVKFDDNGNFIGTVEKEVISNKAIYGAYAFQNARIFLELAKFYINNCPYSECYMSGIYNVAYSQSKEISVYPVDYHLEFGTPLELQRALEDSIWDECILQ